MILPSKMKIEHGQENQKGIHPMKRTLTIILLTLVVAIAATAAPAQDERVIGKSFKVSEGGLLTIDSDLGSIKVRTGKRKVVDIKVVRKPLAYSQESAKKLLENFTVSFTQKDNTVAIQGDSRRDHGRFLEKEERLKVEYIISLPKKFNVDLRTRSGGILVDDLEGKVKAKTSGGSLSFARIVGTIWGRTSGGSISLKGGKAKADIHTSGGSITIQKAKGNVSAHTSGGSVQVEEVLANIEASTSCGSVTASISSQPQGN